MIQKNWTEEVKLVTVKYSRIKKASAAAVDVTGRSVVWEVCREAEEGGM